MDRSGRVLFVRIEVGKIPWVRRPLLSRIVSQAVRLKSMKLTSAFFSESWGVRVREPRLSVTVAVVVADIVEMESGGTRLLLCDPVDDHLYSNNCLQGTVT